MKPFNLTFGRMLLLAALLLLAPQAFAQVQKISGAVTDSSGEPLIGASVFVVGTNKGASTDIDGKYTIEAKSNDKIRFSYVGYKTKTIKIDNRTVINVTLDVDDTVLDEVVVIGYGTMDKKELTSAVSHVSAKDFQSIASTDVSMLIQGKVPGLSVVNTAAADPHSTARLQIRGAA